MFKAIAIAVVLSAAAAPAFANAQFANSIGVEPGVYSLSTMILIERAQHDNDQDVLNALLQRKIGADVSRSVTFDGQIAASARAGSANLSANELVLLKEARRDGHTNPQDVAFIKAGRDGNGVNSDRGVVTGGKAQLAASLGVNPASYTTAELSALAAKKFNADNNK